MDGAMGTMLNAQGIVDINLKRAGIEAQPFPVCCPD